MTPFSELQTAMAELLGAEGVFVPRPDESLIELMRQAEADGRPLPKVTMQDDAWVTMQFNPRVIDGNRSDALAERTTP